MKKIFLALLAALVLPLGFAACSSDDDNDNGGSGTEQQKKIKTTWDDLSFFQNVITDLDTLGNLRGYHYGKELYKDTDPGHLYIGVDEWDEAEDMFREWLAKDVTVTTMTPTTDGLQAELTDEDGSAQLTVYLKPATSSTNVAEVTVSDESKLKYFYQITFMLNDAWPQNDKTSSHWKRFDILYEGYAEGIGEKLDESDYPLNWVCVRSGGNGKRPVFAAITNHYYVSGDDWFRPTYWAILKSRYCPEPSMASSLHGYFTNDEQWNAFVAAFAEAGCGELLTPDDDDDEVGEYLYHEPDHDEYDWGIYYYTGEENYWGQWRGEERRFVLYFDWYDDDECHDDMTIEEDHNQEEDD